jgi:hypothetical protein
MSWLNSFKKRPSAIINLACAIVKTSDQCAQEFKKLVDEKFGKDSKEAMESWLLVQYEFLFFFAHLANRSAFSRLGNNKRTKLQNLLGPILADSTTEAWFGHWPEKLKEGIKHDFYNNINVAELEYSKCKKLFPEKDEGTKDTLFWELGKNIAELSGWDHNPTVIVECMCFSFEKFAEMKLDELIDSAGKEI